MCIFTKMVATALVGPNSLFREGLKGILHAPYQAETVAETIDAVQHNAELGLIILIADTDYEILRAQVRSAKEDNANARVVVMGDSDGADVVWPLLAAGADGYLLNSISPEALRTSLDAVMLGATVVLPTPRGAFTIEKTNCESFDKGVSAVAMQKLDAEAEHKKLSGRETEILLCLTKGESNKQIARKFEITEATVKVHLKAILRKIRVSNRTQAAVWAHNNYSRVARPPWLPQAPLAEFRQGANAGSVARPSYGIPHKDRVRQKVVVQESALIAADSVN